jgi:hypothetical protein
MAEMTVQMFFPLLFSCIVYFLVGFQVQHKRSLIISQFAIR